MGDCEPLTGDPVTKGQADWLTTLYATQIRLQAGRVAAMTRARADLPNHPDTVTLAPHADRIWEAELGLLLAALVSFKNTLCVIAQSFANAPTLQAIHDEFDAAIPDLADFRNALVHGEDWVRGQGGGKRRARRYMGSQTLLSGPTNSNRDLCVVSFRHEGDERQKFFHPDQALRATELALAALAGKRQPGDPDNSERARVD